MTYATATGISVLICSYNGAKNLPATLRHLACQKVNPDINWEVILIDNASTDSTKHIAEQVWKSCNSNVSLLIKDEMHPGKDRAMDTGLAMARYSYVIVCDDDNWLNEDYLQKAFTIMESNPSIGMLGGKGIPVSDKPLPEWFNKAERQFAVGKQYLYSGEIPSNWMEMRFVWGAGAVIRTRAYQMLLNCDFRRILTYAKYGNLARSEDMELSLAIRLTGYTLWFEEGLIYKHYIQGNRITWAYYIYLTKLGAQANPFLNPYHHLTSTTLSKFDYSMYWKMSLKRRLLVMIKSLRMYKNILYSLRVLFRLHREGDLAYHAKFREWLELYGLYKSRKKHQQAYNQVSLLKRKIAEHRNTTLARTQQSGNFNHHKTRSC